MDKFRTISRLLSQLALVALAVIASGCDKGPDPVEGFVLPKGDVDRGKNVFVTIGCRNCHTITGEEFPELAAPPAMSIEIGGKVYRVKTYGELLTSIVNPSHSLAPQYRLSLDPAERKNATTSPMPSFNNVLTVEQLIDLSEYLHSRYEQLSPEYRGYSYVRE